MLFTVNYLTMSHFVVLSPSGEFMQFADLFRQLVPVHQLTNVVVNLLVNQTEGLHFTNWKFRNVTLCNLSTISIIKLG